jgi:2'-5' RNA ligase
MAETALIVVVPEAEPHVSHLRRQFDPAASRGLPAHITVLYPFMPPEDITAAVSHQIGVIALSFAAFRFQLSKVGVFPGALYLAPSPAQPFVALTLALARHFPEYPPYGGQFRNVVPHLTVAQAGGWQQSSAHTELLCALYPSGDISSRCSELVLTEDSSGRWEKMRAFPLSVASNEDG